LRGRKNAFIEFGGTWIHSEFQKYKNTTKEKIDKTAYPTRLITLIAVVLKIKSRGTNKNLKSLTTKLMAK